MKSIIFQLSKQYTSSEFYNYNFGVYYKRLYSEIAQIVDDYNVTGNYNFQFQTAVNIATITVNNIPFSKMESLSDCIVTTETFFYEHTSQKIYLHFSDNSRQLDKEINVGVIMGFSNVFNGNTSNFYNSILYDERLKDVTNPSKKADASFFGKLKYSPFTAKFINTDGFFDRWVDGNFYATECQVLFADNAEVYEDFEQIASGFISDHSITSTEFSLTCDDPRKGLEQPVATNILTTAEFASLPDDSKDARKPVVYGKAFKRKCTLVNDTTHQYVFCDTQFNIPTVLNGVYNDTGTLTPATTTLSSGTFTLSAASDSDVFATFTMPITNGVSIIKDLLLRYDNKTFISSYWDITEVDAAQALCTNTSIYDSEGKKLSELIEKICFDCDLRFFIKDNGKYTIRKYDANRTPVKTILWDDWADDFTITNTGSDYLTDCTVKYEYNEMDSIYNKKYFNSDYQSISYDTYKKYKTKEFDSGLYEQSAAIAKSNTIMLFSYNIKDIVERSVNWNFYDLELFDFVYAAPKTRVKNISNEVLAKYEVIGISKNLNNKTIKLTLKEV